MIFRWIVLASVAVVAVACSSGGSRSAAVTTTTTTAGAATAPASSVTTGTAPRPCTTAPTAAGGGGGGKDANPPGDIPDTQAFVTYAPAGGLYTVKVPEGWARTEGAGTARFSDKFNSVRIDVVAQPVGPTVETATANEVPALAARVPCFRAGKVSTVPRAGGTAVLITYQAQGDPDPVTGKSVTEDVERYEFWQNGHEAVLTLSAPAGSDNVDPWKLVTDSFRWR